MLDDPKADAPLQAAPREDAAAPLVLIPVTAEDVWRKKRRLRIIGGCAALVIALAGYWIYRHTMDPVHAQQSYDSGLRLFTVARYQQAILSFDRAIQLKSDYADAYWMRGRAFVGESRTDRAIADFTRVIELRPSDVNGYIDRARAYIDVKDFPSAIADTNAALRLNPELAAAYALRGTAIRALGDPRKALDDFDEAVKLQPDSNNYYQRGATYHMLGDYRRAIADFTEMIGFDRYNPEGFFARAQSRRALGDARGAEEDHRMGRFLDGR